VRQAGDMVQQGRIRHTLILLATIGGHGSSID
jgi:hypothetical protein